MHDGDYHKHLVSSILLAVLYELSLSPRNHFNCCSVDPWILSAIITSSAKYSLIQALVNRFSPEYEEENSKLNEHFLLVTFLAIEVI